VPFRKRDAEAIRNISELRASDKGGMIFQPEPGVYGKVHQIDFTSLYPSIIVKYNLSPETIEHLERTSFTLDLITFLQDLAPGKCLRAFRRSGRLAKCRTIEICVRSCCPSMHQLTHMLSPDWMSLESSTFFSWTSIPTQLIRIGSMINLLETGKATFMGVNLIRVPD